MTVRCNAYCGQDGEIRLVAEGTSFVQNHYRDYGSLVRVASIRRLEIVTGEVPPRLPAAHCINTRATDLAANLPDEIGGRERHFC
jgi:hypothetical protein